MVIPIGTKVCVEGKKATIRGSSGGITGINYIIEYENGIIKGIHESKVFKYSVNEKVIKIVR
ncbi:hypothetical protein HQN89_04970 [Paenibacillus frigoriresistens]|uniref:hypothetical protein n=1 Tax=Paenibacillus alginolyticus TaxID=59839 RepID=UPI001566F3A8|nr:hypothetical protein [Paenibacillus frigoriresistens]NRF90387.1 hypothetical protein [Paenibacillus frigoriresistens]